MKATITRCIALFSLFGLVFGFGLPSYPAAAQDQDPSQPAPALEYIPGQVLVRFKPTTSAQRVDQVLAERAAKRLRRIPKLDVEVLELPNNLPVEQAVEIFSRLPDVSYAEPNYLLYIAQTSSAWQDNQWAPQKLQVLEAWSLIPNPAPVTIAIVDTGVDYRHSQIQPNMNTNLAEQNGQDGVDDDANGYIDDVYGWDFINNDADPLDDHFHGTHVAGIAAATTGASAESMTGICPSCKIMAVKVLGADGSGALDKVASGITYAADNGARVINLSLGAAFGATTLQSAVDYAWNKGSVIVAAAGNNGADIRSYPAAYPNAIAVASTNDQDYRSCYSNYGNYSDPFVKVAAPGERIYATTPVNAEGGDTYAVYSGTSMATPHVTGLAGLLFAQDVNRTNSAVRQLVEATTVDLGPAGADPFFGTGLVNAYRAVTGDQGTTTSPDGIFTTNLTGSGYAHARKLARDVNNLLHLVWHTRDVSNYRVRYATSSDQGASWSLQPDIYIGSLETYHPALALDGEYVYVAYPQKSASSGKYQVFFSRKSLAGGGWSQPVLIAGGTYDAVRPDLYVDPSNGRLHLVSASLDNAQFVYYRASTDQGLSWTPVTSVNPTNSSYNTRYASVHANGDNVYIAARSLAPTFLGTNYYLHTVRSTDGGATWFDQTQISSFAAFLSGEYGVSLAGIEDRQYMGYETGSGSGGGLYFRRNDGAGWSDYLLLESSGLWPSISQAQDGQAWLIWEDAGSLEIRHYTGSAWEPAQMLLEATGLNKGYYPNLKLGASDGKVEWVYTHCSGAPFRLVYGSLDLNPPPPGLPNAPMNLTASAKSEAAIDLTWTDNAADETGFEVERSLDGSSGWSIIGTTGTDQASYSDTGLSASTTYYYRVRAFNANGYSSFSNIASATTLAPPASTEVTASGETTVLGTRSGDYLLTHANDGSDETITEIESGGKPANRTSYLEHKWTFTVQPGSQVTLHANAWSPKTADGEGFEFQYSTDDRTYIAMFILSKTVDDDVYEVASLPGTFSGTVSIRVVDTDRTAGKRLLDTVYVDHLFLQAEAASGDPPSTLSIHVGDLDASTTAGRPGRWNATVAVAVHDANEAPVPGGTVSGAWSGGTNGSGSCITDGSGRCEIAKTGIKDSVTSLTFSVTDVSGNGMVYLPDANHDGDGDSDGTTIIIK